MTELSPEDEKKLAAYADRLDEGDPRRAKLAELIATTPEAMQRRQDEDLEPVRKAGSYALKKIDQVTGAPTRKLIAEMQAGDEPGSVGRVVEQFGKDPDTAPTWPEIAKEAGAGETLQKAAGLVGPFLEPHPPIGVAFGMAKKIGRGVKTAENVVDFEKALASRGSRELSAADKLAGETGKVLGDTEDYLPKTQEKLANKKYYERRDAADKASRDGFKKTMSEVEEEGAISPKRRGLREADPSLDTPRPNASDNIRQSILARFGPDQEKLATRWLDDAEKSGKPYITNADTKGNMPVTMPNPNFVVGKEIGHRGIMHQATGATDHADPLAWMDDKYQVTRKALENAKGPVRINTSSDLIAKGGYIEAIPPGSSVHIYGLSNDKRLNRLLFPGNPSQKRLAEAVKKLESVGVKVKLEMPTVDEYLDRARAANVKDPRKISDLTGLSEETTLRDMLKDAGLRETRLQSVDGLDPFGQEAKSKRVRPKKQSEIDDE
jgi:hypothetical protein